MSESTSSRILLALFGLNRAGQILWGLIFVLGIGGFVYWTLLPGLRFSEADEGLFRAARHGDRAGIEASLQAGAGLNDVSPVDGKTALFRAAVFGHSDIVALLLDRGGDPEVRGSDGKTALEVVRAAREEEKNLERQRSLDAVAQALDQARKAAQ